MSDQQALGPKRNPRGNPNWVKGISQNPAGRPKGIIELRGLAREYTEESIRVIADIMQSEVAKDSDRLIAASILLDRGWGKPTQPISNDEDPQGIGGDVYEALLAAAERINARHEAKLKLIEVDPKTGTDG
jgi:uncharacterized protein (UPF0254 family)